MLEGAIILAMNAHMNQKDKGGKPYILHPLRVMLSLKNPTETEQIVAVLHDIFEDSDFTGEDVELLFLPEVYEAVMALTRREGEIYRDYILRVKENPIARKVKIADLRDNLDPVRSDNIPDSLRRRYRSALRVLEF
jgi:(p)ppGpp synthase/HD superfamily hydrolase